MSKEELETQIKDIYARACKNNEYFGKDGWYELHTPTLTNEINDLINQALREQLEEIEKQTVTVLPETYPTGERKSIEATPLSVIKQLKEKL